MKTYVTLSITLHILIFIALQKTAPVQVNPSKKSSTIEINVFNESELKPKVNPRVQKKINKRGANYFLNKRQSNQSQKTKTNNLKPKDVSNNGEFVNLKKLLPSYALEQHLNSDKTISNQDIPISAINRWNYDPYSPTSGVYGVLNNMTTEEYLPHISFYEALWSKIYSQLSYPKDIALERIKGKVSFHLIVNHKGEFVRFLKILGPQDVLTTFATLSLYNSLSEANSSRHYLATNKLIPISVQINFKLITMDEIVHRPKGNHIKNTFVFNIYKRVPVRANQYIAEQVAPRFPPIVPIPGGAIIDFYRAYQMIKNWNKPLKNDRREAYLKKWHKLLKLSIKKQAIEKF